MANVEVENIFNFVDKRQVAGQATDNLTTPANFADVAALRARLTAINSTYYTATLLNKMTRNDMVYAVRLSDEAAGI